MLSFFISISLSKKPVILIPGMYGSNLYANYTDAHLQWFCPKSGEDELIWGNPLRLIRPMYQCTFGLLREYWNNSEPIKYPNISIKPKSFGPLDDILYKYKIPGITYGISGDFANLVKAYIKKGYRPGVDLLAAPYDFRRAPMYLGDYYTDLKNLIEKARVQNRRNVTLVAFDLGALVMQRFLLKNVTWGWKKANVRNTVMVAPDLVGSIRPFLELRYSETERIPFLQNQYLGGALSSWAATYAQLPNFNVFTGENLVRFPLQNTTSYQVPNLLARFGLVRGTDIQGLNRSLRILRKELNDYEVPTTVIYNSGIKTLRSLEFPQNPRKYPKVEFSDGDGLVLSDGPKYICSRWSNIRCIDVKNDGRYFRHQRFMNNPYVVDLTVNASIVSAWAVKGRLNEVAPQVTTIPFFGYYINQNVRARKIYSDL
ncbi:Lecithin:cholesterol acyltransferase family protein [Trichomonas vaginalis G3]|uniref:Lecithin:cholesterol acyltransferase family protein n=1 Tax=Trichomonas vaginalis (strain ATCC PRA-98 / G3) TaxID=412133 RepID=A2FLZ4_TRIV3|nr:O-acyltransferase protein [Trichomonas vaginalis G3]EAX94083.1 Lecithin:cholesterol acyltransferase family protein [Trichomonas vaginalis G3]KAI5488073.1 O-acyltransferase protein [Trichomonas vaginalis G3]|eukprot:XP_001307013.1 Lecithin:cholesterol acyltransferase family protein [Trichomonas vaginalis G3]